MKNAPQERLFALVARWEYQCCGEPLVVGAVADLTLSKRSDGPLPGPDGEPVEWVLEHHIAEEPTRHVRARIAALWEWRVRREYRRDERAWYPIEGTDEFMPIDRMEVWDEGWQPALSDAGPQGWAVELDLLSVLEPNRDGIPYGG